MAVTDLLLATNEELPSSLTEVHIRFTNLREAFHFDERSGQHTILITFNVHGPL